MFCFGRSAQEKSEKLEFYNQGLTSERAKTSPVASLFPVSFTYKSRTDSEPVPANRSNLKVNFSIAFHTELPSAKNRLQRLIQVRMKKSVSMLPQYLRRDAHPTQ
jgi:hypothetical protein